jgi:5-methylcytosine-specific restriction endonuclease McrA
MAMSHIYQPVMIRTILEGGGAATRRQIAAAISAADVSQLEYYEQVIKRYPGPVLRKRGIVEEEKGVFRLAPEYRGLNEWERAELRAVCDLRIADYVARRQDRIWAHRAGNLDPVPGTVRWQVISRAMGRCEGCGIDSNDRALEADHIVPRDDGGTNDLWNLQALCSLCNNQKSNGPAVDFRAARKALDARHENCVACQAPAHEGLENELARVLNLSGGPVVAPRRHGASYLQLFQPEVIAMRQLERAVAA